ncbi:hypothetical protein C9374_009551 [Naegleria lovaniensis]|uniref:Serine hydrolase domain-containing protein n=1 Tax=Naegleria lovaniensis TaxID=51637 RepID=A0AA88H3H8_NAELO|nr:uncharacterized protein C9374_009551 [Naegleria lovaniensis]KAG2392974.1 hypothetical protein C9374_009551 [Naegleria lovaniensis]
MMNGTQEGNTRLTSSTSKDVIKPSLSTIVMIHGWLQNGKIFKDKSAAFRKQFPNHQFAFSFPNAPFVQSKQEVSQMISSPARVINSSDDQDNNNTESEEPIPDEALQRTWVFSRMNRTVYARWRESILYLLNYMRKERKEGKRIDGLLGFSQGGAMVTVLAALISMEYHNLLNRECLPSSLYEPHPHDEDETNFDDIIEAIRELFFTVHPENGKKECTLKLVILVGTFKPNSIQINQVMETLMSRNLKIGGFFKTLHIYGLNDDVIKPERSQELAEDWYVRDSTVILTHPKKHILPTGSEVKEELRRFIKSSL